ncbi:MAG: substrate-binding domain-containing protein [Phycisphaerae bacterium]
MSNSFLRIAVMVGIQRNYAREILHGVERYCSAQASTGAQSRRWQMAVYPLADIVRSPTVRQRMRQWRPDGILAEINSPSLARFCAGFKKPVVQLMHPMALSGFPRIGLDDFAVGRQAAEYFLQKGYRSFAYCSLEALNPLDPLWLRWSKLRKDGFVQAINEFFRRLDGQTAAAPPVSIFPGVFPNAHAHGRKTHCDPELSITKWLTTLPPHTAVFCGCDYWAGFLLRAAEDAHLQVPDHLAVLGVDDDVLFCQLVDPPLSSIATRDDRIGWRAAKLLGAMLAGAAAPAEPDLLTPFGVTERQSSDNTVVVDADVHAALDYIKKHAAEHLGVKTLMPHLSVSRRSLEMKFQRKLGHSLAEEIHRVRLEHLKTLLRGAMSIGEIVRRMNYSSSQYLARAFKRDTGMSPSQYRRKSMHEV